MKKFKQLTVEQRYQISALLQSGSTQKQIANIVGVSESTISRELSRNKGKHGKYSPVRAQMLADERKERFGRNRRFTSSMKRFIDKKIREEQWSPEQINGYCKINGIDIVSVERIYQYIPKTRQKEEIYTHSYDTSSSTGNVRYRPIVHLSKTGWELNSDRQSSMRKNDLEIWKLTLLSAKTVKVPS